MSQKKNKNIFGEYGTFFCDIQQGVDVGGSVTVNIFSLPLVTKIVVTEFHGYSKFHVTGPKLGHTDLKVT